MTPERWAEVKAVVAEAMESSDRDAYLARACGSDTALRNEVESLLSASDDGDSVPGARSAVIAAHEGLMAERDATLRTVLERALGSQYEIVRQLGHGGMGAVYLARDRVLERFVAVKVLRPDLADSQESRDRFRREARIAAQLSHPGILPLHSFGEIEGLWYFVMGFVRGQSLADRLRLEGALPTSDARQILIELADAVAWAHRHGVIHRDIKPANVLLDDESGRTILADFGISKLKDTGDSLTVTGTVWGSPRYMSPEQGFNFATVDERSDIYSLGAVGYCMVAGCEPFADAKPEDLPFRRLTADPDPLQVVAPNVPPDLSYVIMRCLVRDPAGRWPSASELREALARTAEGPAALLPESVRDLPSFAPYAMLWGVAWAMVAVSSIRAPLERLLMLLVAIIVPFGLLLHVWNVGKHGMRLSELVRAASWPPEWWGMWWPRALRRPTDLWSRLPWPARLVRLALSTFLVSAPAAVMTRQYLDVKGARLAGLIPNEVLFAIEGLLVLVTGGIVAAGLWWTRRRGLSLADATRFLFGPTVPSPAWNKPEIARLLYPPGDVRPPDRDSPSDHRRAIAERAAILPPEAREIGTLTVQITQRLLRAIEQCDREVASLMHNASAAELDRLETQLTALQRSDDRDDREHNDLRALVQHQLDIVRRMHARAESLSDRRMHLLQLMRGLWSQLGLVRSAERDAAQGVALAASRLKQLCDDVAAEIISLSQFDAAGGHSRKLESKSP